MSQLYVSQLHLHIVGRIESIPGMSVTGLYPGMRLSFAFHESTGITSRNTPESAEGNHQMSKVLTNTLMGLDEFRYRRIGCRYIGYITHRFMNEMADAEGCLKRMACFF